MKLIVNTMLYSFSINLERINNMCLFEIIAINNSNNTKSSITNLNFIISELLGPIISFEDYESSIQINTNIGNKIYNKSVELFNDSNWLLCLFNALEDDIEAGAWSNVLL